MEAAPALTPAAVLRMDALFAVHLCAERARMMRQATADAGGGGGGGGGGRSNVTDLPGGRRQISIGSMDELAGLLKGGR